PGLRPRPQPGGGGAAPPQLLRALGELIAGLSVCYDLRFPELYRILAVRGARLIAVPSAFTLATGRDHWEVLLRARAIENQVFVLAPNQVGEAPPHHSSYGRSAIVDPWGVVLATAPDGERFVAADLDLAAQERIRASLPSLANRRPEAYVWPQEVRA
ncbi:MAG TPA: nitrilase-related carbon-nitrogen hydrolase, partial [Solirubrobacterales bacterium]